MHFFYSKHLTFTLFFSLSPLPRPVLSSLSQYTDSQRQTLCKPIINEPIGQIECNNKPQPAWDKAQCTTLEVTDASINPILRWDSVNTEDAWTAALADWKAKGNNGLTFPQEISNFFHGPEQMLCGDTSSRDGCGSYIVCNNVNHPGGMFILNSFVALSNLNYNLYDALGKAEGSILADVGKFAKTFAPIDDESVSLKLALDLLSLGFAMFVSPMWNSALKSVPFFKTNGNTLGTIKDEVNPIVSNGITIAKDTTIAGAQLTAQNDLSTNVGNLVKIWYQTIDTYNNNLFNGSDASIKELYSMITGGKVLEPGFQEDELNTQGTVEKAIYGFLIPAAWPLSNRDSHPVVIDAKAPCGTINPLEQWIDNDGAGRYFVCNNGGLYYLMSTTTKAGDALNCGDGGEDMAVSCSQSTFPYLPGLDTLDGTAWGGITKDDFVAGALNSYNANGKKNGWPLIDPSTENARGDIFDNGVRAVGVVQIPVCGADEAYNNWSKIGRIGGGGLSKNFPCN